MNHWVLGVADIKHERPKLACGGVLQTALVVDFAEEPVNGDCVLARLSDKEGGDILFKLHRSRDAGREVILSSYNPSYQPLTVRREDILWIYPMVGMARIFQRHH